MRKRITKQVFNGELVKVKDILIYYKEDRLRLISTVNLEGKMLTVSASLQAS